MERIRTENLSIGYDKELVSRISLFAAPGTVTTLIGPNGCGKTTLLKTLAGELKSLGGVIYLNGKDTKEASGSEIARTMAVVSTERIRPEFMTCLEVVETGRYPYTGRFGILSEDDRRIAREALESVHASDIAQQDFGRISDGQRQRIMLARAICQKPQVLVLDEPTSFLDIRHRLDILDRIKELASRENVAVIMSLHELDHAMRISDHVVALGEGKVLRSGIVEEVFEEAFIRRLFDIEEADLSLLGSAPWITGRDLPERKRAWKPVERRCAVIMVQGTMSNVGKSVIAAGLCRIFTQDGYRTAPFKSQNMALNSYVTGEGLEMGRAQVMQAECCRRKPVCAMNPILLKPTDDRGSQVIVNGIPVGNMKAEAYFGYKQKLIPDIMKAFEKLQEDSDIIVIEGAGSPAEINLKEHDIVNMGLAEMTDAPVLLVGDINPGGVFAQLLGTLDLLTEDERERVHGLIINRFRGDENLLKPGLDMLEAMGGKPVLGVIPWMEMVLDDEDSLTDRFKKREKKSFDIAVIRFPHIANFTDFNVFEESPEISVRYITEPGETEGADILFLPGSKNTIADLEWLKSRGFAETIREASAAGTVVIGICGGYQMLGMRIEDPWAEEAGGTAEGLSLLPVHTVITREKTRTLYRGVISEPEGILKGLAGTGISGYEIHMGCTYVSEGEHAPGEDISREVGKSGKMKAGETGRLSEFTSGGTGICTGNVYGTYVHGFFDDGEAARKLISLVAEARNKQVDLSVMTDYAAYRDQQYDRLADILRAHLDMEKIYQIMGLSHDQR